MKDVDVNKLLSQSVEPDLNVNQRNDKHQNQNQNQVNNMKMKVNYELDLPIANQIVDDFLLILKNDYGNKIDPLFIESIGPIDFENWGSYYD